MNNLHKLTKPLTKPLATLSLLLASFALSATADAQEFAQGVRPAGMGQAHTGVAHGTDAIFYNPAGLASDLGLMQIDGSYHISPTGSVAQLALMDSQIAGNLAVGAAAGFYFGRGAHDHLSGQDLRLAIGLPAIADRLWFGAQARYLGVSVAGANDRLLSGFTFDLAALARLNDSLQFGLTGQNLVDVCDTGTNCSAIAPRTITGGLSILDPGSYTLALDVGADLNSDPNANHPFLHLGAEFIVGVVPLRVGYQRLQFGARNMLTAGVGLHGEVAALDVGLRMDLSDPDHFFANAAISLATH